MKNVAVFDIEAQNWTQFELLGFYDGREYREFDNLQAFLYFFITKQYEGFRCYAHFGGGYDFKFILPLLVEMGYGLEIIDKGSGMLCIKIIKGNHRWYFYDSYYLLPASLKALGKMFKVKHQKRDIDFTKDFGTQKMKEYLQDDCLCLYEVLEAFCGWGMSTGRLRSTIGAQSMAVFQDNFGVNAGQIKPTKEKTEEFIRQCYYGGRVEIFKTYGDNLKYYDVNSLYPFAMLGDMPTGEAVYTKGYKVGKIGFYKVRVQVPKCHIGFMPYVHDEKLFFPWGEFESFVTDQEIKQCDDENIPVEVLDGYYFTGKQELFREYVEHFYKIKSETKDQSEYYLSKLMLNNLYGKFGQKREGHKIILPENFSDIIEKKMIPYNEKLGLYKVETINQSRRIAPQISAYITSKARLHLYQLLKQAGEDSVFYCDTDSVVTTSTMPTGLKIGELKQEYDGIVEGCFVAPKMYGLKLSNGNEVIRVKGMDKQSLDYGIMKSLLSGGEYRNKTKRILGFKENVRRFDSLAISRVDAYKDFKTRYTKRRILGHQTENLNVAEILAL